MKRNWRLAVESILVPLSTLMLTMGVIGHSVPWAHPQIWYCFSVVGALGTGYFFARMAGVIEADTAWTAGYHVGLLYRHPDEEDTD